MLLNNCNKLKRHCHNKYRNNTHNLFNLTLVELHQRSDLDALWVCWQGKYQWRTEKVETEQLRHFHKFKTKGMYFGCKHAFLLSGKVRVEGQQVIIDDDDLAEQILDLLRAG